MVTKGLRSCLILISFLKHYGTKTMTFGVMNSDKDQHNATQLIIMIMIIIIMMSVILGPCVVQHKD